VLRCPMTALWRDSCTILSRIEDSVKSKDLEPDSKP
jgi:hypothetical protein